MFARLPDAQSICYLVRISIRYVRRTLRAEEKKMSQAAAQASSFYTEVAASKCVWTIRDSGGYPAPMTSSGKRAQPFWSSENRAQLITKNVAAFQGFAVERIDWDIFRNRWVVGLEKEGFLVGVNWSGKTAKGYDIEPKKLVEYVESLF